MAVLEQNDEGQTRVKRAVRFASVCTLAVVWWTGLSARPHLGESDSLEVCTAQEWLTQGHFGGRVRTFAMGTANIGEARDYWTLAQGARLHYRTATFKGFTVHVEGVFAFRLAGNDLNAVDPASGKTSRFERQLYDLEHPDNFDDLDRLEQLYVAYRHAHGQVQWGRMAIQTPIVNPHDGRMKPKVVSGLWGTHHVQGVAVHAGWFHRTSPRSTTHWMPISEAIGIYNTGCANSPEGTAYRAAVQTKGLAIAGLERSHGLASLTLWNYWLENISNTTLLTWEHAGRVHTGAQLLAQHRQGQGGNANRDLAYHPNAASAWAVSGRVGTQLNEQWHTEVAATQVGPWGVYRFPRELGVDPFFTHLTRGWLEGLSNATAATFRVERGASKWRAEYAVQRIQLHGNPDDLSRNKYGQLSHWQHNVELHWRPEGWLAGSDWMLLYVHTGAINQDVPAERTFNRYGMHHFNVVFNLRF